MSDNDVVKLLLGLITVGGGVIGWLLNRSIGQVDAKLTQVDQRFSSVDGKLDKLADGHGELRDRVTVLEVAAGIRGAGHRGP